MNSPVPVSGKPNPVLTRRGMLAIAMAAAAARRPLRGQDEEPTFKTDVKVVNVLASVRDRKGQIIRDLPKDAFTILEDGHPQTVRYYATQSDLPLTVGLLVDTSMSQEKVLDAERGASFRFLDQVLREKKDQFFIMQFDMSVQMRQALTDSRQKLEQALSYVDTPSRSLLRIAGSGPGTVLYDAVLAASKDPMAAQHGRKALIILSDGVDTGSENTLAASIEAAQKADTLIYSILFSDAGAYGFMGGGADGKSVLMRLARETGGGFFAVSKKLSIEQIFAVLEEELRSQYSLGYVSDRPVRISEFRKLQVSLDRKDLKVQARERYWAQR